MIPKSMPPIRIPSSQFRGYRVSLSSTSRKIPQRAQFPNVNTLIPHCHSPYLFPLRTFSVLPGPLNYDGVFRELRSIKFHKPWMQALRERDEAARGALANGASGAVKESRKQEEADLKPKRMRDSFHSLVLPFSKDEWLVDTYVNASGQLRMGTLFQDLDALAGVISYKHTGPYPTIVTAAVDRISIISPLLSRLCDLELSGFVSYVGRSSMEISIEVRKVDPPEGENPLLLTCAFTMVALDPVTKKATPIAPLIVETEEEKRIFGRGEVYKTSKKALADAALTKQTPNDEESDLIHYLWLQNQKLKSLFPPLSLSTALPTYMSTTRIHSTSIMQPQYRNRHSFMIFGGHLLKLTFELAFCCCSASTRSRPAFISLDPSTFLAPVPVGSILYLTATVAYAEPGERQGEVEGKGRGTRVQVRVESKVRDVEHGSEKETGVFNYTFWVDREGWEVMPVTYSEFMDYVDARRRARQWRELREVGAVQADDGTRVRLTE